MLNNNNRTAVSTVVGNQIQLNSPS